MANGKKVRYTMFRLKIRWAIIETKNNLKSGGSHGKFIIKKCLQSLSEWL